MMIRPDLDRNERQALLVSHRYDVELVKTILTGVVLVAGGCGAWIVAAAAINLAIVLIGGH